MSIYCCLHWKYFLPLILENKNMGGKNKHFDNQSSQNLIFFFCNYHFLSVTHFLK